MENQTTENKRKSARGNVSLKVSCRKVESFLSSASRIQNLSETGIGMSLDLNLPVNTLVEVVIILDDAKNTIKTLARVVRISPRNDNSGYRFDAGLEFLDLPTPKRNMISHYINRSK